MRLSKRQLKRIIREEYSKLKRQGILAESYQDNHAGTASAELHAVCLDKGMSIGQAGRMGKLYTKIDHCSQSMSPDRCADMLDDTEYMDVAELQQCLMACQNAECKEMLLYTKRL